jgi:8-oxo-dGTP pyrophosphatase MutT (NUDIX family)
MINCLEDANFRLLMIRRKDSLGYIELLRGKYQLSERGYVQTLIEQTSLAERERLLSLDFTTLWEGLWNGPVSKPYRHEFEPAKMKFEALRTQFLYESIQTAKTRWTEPEWGFPKGRRGPGESELKCALREFWEETGVTEEQIFICRNIMPIEESFFGSNRVHYRHKYYIAFTFDDIPLSISSNIMEKEIGAIQWFSSDNALEHIRPYNIEKKELVYHVQSLLRNYSFWLTS